ncbi:hypothetical protein M758_2G247100 [Ceratodon purpureus]|uniref:Secreted protein n=1 Tax=Ceratodon purpureus TaxID=3225 RepID=A0A8T0IZI3_CERPU|nr:hypothetical protein KC19_2G293100 [Ceratodon purpureus]KAG0628063.1 hypothetical protein M758_2G247100 [Ceratodon purpureus]
MFSSFFICCFSLSRGSSTWYQSEAYQGRHLTVKDRASCVNSVVFTLRSEPTASPSFRTTVRN